MHPRYQHPVAALDPRDGPPEEHSQHYDIVTRAGKGGGKRRYTRLEQLWKSGRLKPEHAEAGHRYMIDALMRDAGSSTSCLEITLISGGGGGGLLDRRHDAASRLLPAQAYLDDRVPHDNRIRPSDVLTAFCVEDYSLAKIAQLLGYMPTKATDKAKDRAKDRIIHMLTLLAEHYEKVDRASGRSTTQYTAEAAAKRWDPEDD